MATPLKRVKEPEDSLAMLTHIARGQGVALMRRYPVRRRAPGGAQAQRLLCDSAADDAPPPAS
ncbi:LysR family transcriptional regulator|nr:hypothetical protein [Candidatus Pantoea persica]MBA2817295.1 LysR family transcriptional regulator [Candidatus Pantoea persica]